MRTVFNALGPGGFLAVVLIGSGIAYAVSCWLFPFARCRACDGTGRKYNGDRSGFRDCWWCKGATRRLRIGRRLFNAAKRRRDAGRG